MQRNAEHVREHGECAQELAEVIVDNGWRHSVLFQTERQHDKGDDGDDVTEEAVVGVHGHVAPRRDGTLYARPGQQHHEQQRPGHVDENDADGQRTYDVYALPYLHKAAHDPFGREHRPQLLEAAITTHCRVPQQHHGIRTRRHEEQWRHRASEQSHKETVVGWRCVCSRSSVL